jgi:hypothetical protein
MMNPNVHDNFIYAISIHLEERVVILHTHYRDGDSPNEFTDVCFRGVIGHCFQDVVAPSILLDIEEVPPRWVVEEWRAVFERGVNYGWPSLNHRDVDELCRLLEAKSTIGYRVMGSCGLDGFVLAQGVEYRQRNEPVVPP